MADDKLTGPEVLAQWAAAGLHRVLLPSGIWAKVRLPDTEIFIRAGRLPEAVRAIALRFATSGISPSDIKEEDAGPFISFQYALAAATIRAMAPRGSDPDDDASYVTVRLTGAELQESEIPQEDLHALVRIANRNVTPAAVSYSSLVDGGLGQATQAAQAAMREAVEKAGATLPDYADFRGKRSGTLDGADGGEVRAAAVGNDRSRRSSGGVRARRSSRN